MHEHANQVFMCVFFFNDTATTEIYTLSLHDALPILETLRLQGRLNRCELVGYTNSAAVSGDTSRVVGYSSLLFS